LQKTLFLYKNNTTNKNNDLGYHTTYFYRIILDESSVMNVKKIIAAFAEINKFLSGNGLHIASHDMPRFALAKCNAPQGWGSKIWRKKAYDYCAFTVFR